MKRNSRIAVVWLAACSLLFPAMSFAQANPGTPGTPRETTQDLVARLNPQQKQQYDDARKAFAEHRYADSLAIHRLLLKDFPGDPILLKFASEAALQGGDPAFAASMLKSLAQTDPDDWQAAALLTRACAEAGDKPGRDAGIAHMLDLHSRGVTPPQLQQYVVESVKVGEKTLLINTSLVPWGFYKIYALGKVIDSTGKLLLSITLESNDLDQPGFAKKHPDEAAKGMRRFSFDTYTETGIDNTGRRTQSQALYKFIDGEPPPYEAIREEFVKLAAGQGSPIGIRTNLTVP